MTSQPDSIAEDTPVPLVEPAPSPVDDGPQDDYKEDDHGHPV